MDAFLNVTNKRLENVFSGKICFEVNLQSTFMQFYQNIYFSVNNFC